MIILKLSGIQKEYNIVMIIKSELISVKLEMQECKE